MAFVLDASAAMAWCFEDEATPASQALLDRLETEPAVVPALFPVEESNILVMAARRSRITTEDSRAFVNLLLALDLRIDEIDAVRALGSVRELAWTEKLSAYDATYLELARREEVALATRDTALIVAAQHLGVPLLPA